MKRIVAILLVLSLLGGGALVGGFFYIQQQLGKPIPLEGETTVDIPSGTGLKGISEILTEVGLVKHPLVFQAATMLGQNQRNMKAGEYRFQPGMTLRDIIAKIVKGDVVIHAITVPEGLSTADVIELLKQNPKLVGDVTLPVKEGELLPETYHFHRGDTRDMILTRMQAAMQEVVKKAWEARKADLPLRTEQELLTLASIVEKETGKAEERPHVASVYINRLKIGMLLQADPTVQYGLEVAKGAKLDRPLTYVDLVSNTPYNTYVNPGLPPTPIANPGKASIEAIVNPMETKDLYFVAAGDGSHRFAETIEQHNRNVALYRKSQNEAAVEVEAAIPVGGSGTTASQQSQPKKSIAKKSKSTKKKNATKPKKGKSSKSKKPH